jgi:hypothetical protein
VTFERDYPFYPPESADEEVERLSSELRAAHLAVAEGIRLLEMERTAYAMHLDHHMRVLEERDELKRRSDAMEASGWRWDDGAWWWNQ